MKLGQITNTVEYKVTYFSEADFDESLEDHLNVIGKQGWFLHSLSDYTTLRFNSDDLPQKTFRCIWQKISQEISGILK